MVKEYTSVSQSEAVILCDCVADPKINSDIMGFVYGLSVAFIRELVPVRILLKTDRDTEFAEVFAYNVPGLETAFKELMTCSVAGVTGNNAPLLFRVRSELTSVVLVYEKNGEIFGEVTGRV